MWCTSFETTARSKARSGEGGAYTGGATGHASAVATGPLGGILAAGVFYPVCPEAGTSAPESSDHDTVLTRPGSLSPRNASQTKIVRRKGVLTDSDDAAPV